jgi:rhodanese-related sulfurtransferase
VKTFFLAFALLVPILHAAEPNPKIDYPGYLKVARETQPIREKRRITEEQFSAMAAEKDTIVLDARSADKYAMRHIRGAVSLPFTDFTAESLAKVIPTKGTRVLIYCNNNFEGDQIAFAGKARRASLNISTFIALATYGYNNVYELAPLLDVKTTKLPFEGTSVTTELGK